MTVPPQTLVCFAVKEEARFFKKLAADCSHVQTLVTGMGKRNAERSFGLRLQRQKPELVFTCGFAGGLRPGVRRGTVLFSDAAGTGLEEDLRKAGAVPARFHASASVITSPLEKRDLFSSTGADAVEMESFAIAALCRESRLPCVTVRVVLDEAEEKLPLDFNQVLTEDLRISPGKLALELLKSPGKIGALMRLGKQSDFAAKQLAEVLGQVLGCSR